MQFLDDTRNYKNIDPDNIHNSLTKFGRQFDSGWHVSEFAKLDLDLKRVENIVFAGMGGSSLSAEIVKSLSPFMLSKPFELVSNYRLPAYADDKTLVILSSYSGDTEEVLSCTQDAVMRGCQAVCITTGGKLKELSENKNLNLITMDEKFNPSRSPRAGVFLSLGAVLGLMVRINPVSNKYINPKDITQTIERVLDLVSINKDTGENPAKTLAVKHKNLGVIFLSANHLSGVGKVLSIYLNESAKTFCEPHSLPDLNHHFLDGLIYPVGLKDNVNFIILNSSVFPDAIQKRVAVTKEILLKQKYKVTILKPESSDPVLQVFESLAFLIMFSYYLSILNKVNPATNPWVDHLKKELKQ